MLKDEGGKLVAARHGPGKVVVLPPKKTTGIWAKFAAPPAGVTKVSIFIPGTQPFEDVAIEQ